MEEQEGFSKISHSAFMHDNTDVSMLQCIKSTIVPELLGFEGGGEREGGEGEGTGDGLFDFSLEPQSSSQFLLCFLSSASILKHIHTRERMP